MMGSCDYGLNGLEHLLQAEKAEKEGGRVIQEKDWRGFDILAMYCGASVRTLALSSHLIVQLVRW